MWSIPLQTVEVTIFSHVLRKHSRTLPPSLSPPLSLSLSLCVSLSLSLCLSLSLSVSLSLSLSLSVSLSTRQEVQGGPTPHPARGRAPAVLSLSLSLFLSVLIILSLIDKNFTTQLLETGKTAGVEGLGPQLPCLFGSISLACGSCQKLFAACLLQADHTDTHACRCFTACGHCPESGAHNPTNALAVMHAWGEGSTVNFGTPGPKP